MSGEGAAAMTTSTMRAISVGRDLAITTVELPRPQPRPDEILIAPRAAGICGTDLHIVKGEFPQAVFPVIPCHEFAGDVVAVGNQVSSFKEGDLIAADPNVSCGHCRWCLAGRPNLCANLEVIGVTRQGAAAELLALPARCAARLPVGLSAELGAMVEPLACACNAVHRAGSLQGKRVLVMGSGIMGLLITILARRSEPAAVWVSDPAAAKHVVAQAVGANKACTPADLTGERFDVVFEASGAPAATAQVMALLDRMGIWVQVGVLAPPARGPVLPFVRFARAMSLICSNSCAANLPTALDLMPDIAEIASKLVTSRTSVWEFKSGLASALGASSVKAQLSF